MSSTTSRCLAVIGAIFFFSVASSIMAIEATPSIE
jgi:hypothetical protein